MKIHLKIKLIAKQISEKALVLCSDAKAILKKWGDHLISDLPQQMILYRPRLEHVLLIHQEEAIDLLVSIKSSIILSSEEGHAVTFRREGAFLVIQSKGLKMESK